MRTIALAGTLAALAMVGATAGSAKQAKVPTWCRQAIGFCWTTETGAEEQIEKFGADAPPGYVWSGTRADHLAVNTASCIGVLRFGRVNVTAANIYDTVNVSEDEWNDYKRADSPSYAYVIGDHAYHVLDCSFTDGRGRAHSGLFSEPKEAFIRG